MCGKSAASVSLTKMELGRDIYKIISNVVWNWPSRNSLAQHLQSVQQEQRSFFQEGRGGVFASLHFLFFLFGMGKAPQTAVLARHFLPAGAEERP